jgi:hypothetical protein
MHIDFVIEKKMFYNIDTSVREMPENHKLKTDKQVNLNNPLLP